MEFGVRVGLCIDWTVRTRWGDTMHVFHKRKGNKSLSYRIMIPLQEL
jgi:hypothetical protein